MGRNKWANNSWYRGEDTRFGPNVMDLEGPDAVERYIIKDWAPEAPAISPSVNVTAFGSCFAEHISTWLHKRKYNILTKQEGDAYVIVCSEGMVNTFAILGQFEWALENKVPQVELWHGFDAQAFGYRENIRQATRDIFLKTDVFILTFGLSEIWYDEPTGEVFWRAVPYEKFDATRHKFRVSTVEENTRNIRRIYELIRKYRPEAKIIFTLSPVPLVATFRTMPCLSANTISKAILRVAIDNVVSEFGSAGNLYYWPSYEIVMEGFQDRWRPDRRHVKRPILDYVMMQFEKAWCTLPPTQAELDDALMQARIAEGAQVGRYGWTVTKGKHERSEAILKGWERDDRTEMVEFARRWRANFAAGTSENARRYANAAEKAAKKAAARRHWPGESLFAPARQFGRFLKSAVQRG